VSLRKLQEIINKLLLVNIFILLSLLTSTLALQMTAQALTISAECERIRESEKIQATMRKRR
jgi:hypothetical protein